MHIFCNHCKELNDTEVSIKFIKIALETLKNLNDRRNPKWNFMLKAVCKKCRSYIKFLPQTEDIIQALQDKIFL